MTTNIRVSRPLLVQAEIRRANWPRLGGSFGGKGWFIGKLAPKVGPSCREGLLCSKRLEKVLAFHHLRCQSSVNGFPPPLGLPSGGVYTV